MSELYLPNDKLRSLFKQKMGKLLPNLQTSLSENGNLQTVQSLIKHSGSIFEYSHLMCIVEQSSFTSLIRKEYMHLTFLSILC